MTKAHIATALLAAAIVTVLALESTGTNAQSSAGALPRFEVASIRRGQDSGPSGIGDQPGGRMTATNLTLWGLVREAYQLQEFQLLGGPDWIKSDRFTVNAKADHDVPEAASGIAGELRLMLRSLLFDRFGLVTHEEQRDMPVYALVLAHPEKTLGPKLQRFTGDCLTLVKAGNSAGTTATTSAAAPPQTPQTPATPLQLQRCGRQATMGPPSPVSQIRGRGIPVEQLTASLATVVRRSIVDRTGLTGSYDYEVLFATEQMTGSSPVAVDDSAPSFFTAITEQLGLKLESQRAPATVVVVDSARRPSTDD